MKAQRTASQPGTCSLAELQRTFQSALVNGEAEAPPFIAESATATAAARFGVYTEAYRLRLIEALGVDYPALKRRLGESDFDRLGRAYADACPSSHFSIRWFGARLPAFLADTPPYDRRPELQELAAFEWALSEAFDAADADPVTQAQLAALEPAQWPKLQLRFHPSLRLVDLACNTADRWRALQREESPPPVEWRAQGQIWAVWRHQLKLLFRALTPAETVALTAFINGGCFAEVCEALCDPLEEAEVAAAAAGFLQSWLREGWVVGVATTGENPSDG